MQRRLVIVGGVAGGATAAARAKRLDKTVDVTVIEKGPDVSFANCGLPYYIGREITDRSKLSLQTPQSLSDALKAKVLTMTEALAVDPAKKEVTVKANGETKKITYDALILSPGASPLRPPLKGIDNPKIVTLRNLQDMDRIDALVHLPATKRIAVIGAGFIGLEVVEQLHRIEGKTVTLIERTPTVLPQADEEISSFLHNAMIEKGVQLVLGDCVESFEQLPNGALRVNLATKGALEVDAVVLAIGVRPDSKLAVDAGIKTVSTGHIATNGFMQTDKDSIYAVGDVVETADLVFPDRRAVAALGNVANMQARIAVDHYVKGSKQQYKGSLGTAIVRVFDNTLAVTGWSEKRLKAAGIPYATTTVTADNHAGYYPGALPITIKITFDPVTGRLYGGQAVGIDGVDKRVDVLATAITGGLTVEDLSLTQLCYSPPFGSARDVANIAGLAGRNIRDKLVTPKYSLTDPSTKYIDVRPADAAALHPIPNSINIPLGEVEEKGKSLDKSLTYTTVCNLGKTSYFAARKLSQLGLNVNSLVGGLRVHDKPVSSPPAPGSATSSSGPCCNAGSPPPQGGSGAVVNLDCTGMSCPGPLLKLKSTIDALSPGAQLVVTATDPGFAADLKAFVNSRGLTLLSVGTERGIVTGKLINAAPGGAAAPAPGTGNASGARKGATIVVFSKDMDKVLAAFVIANGAAAMGGDVTMFFTFWGLNALRHPHRSGGRKSIVEAAFGKMMPRGINKLQLSNYSFGGIGALLMKSEMKKKNLPNIPSLMQQAKAQKIRMVACTMSMDAMGISKDELIEGIEYGGVADYLASAEKSGTNLFV